jgi:pyruvate kinase
MHPQEIQPFGKPFTLSTPQGLLSTLQELRQTVEAEEKANVNELNPHIKGWKHISKKMSQLRALHSW